MRIIKLFLVFIIMLLGAVFAVLNAEPVVFNYYFGSRELPLSLIMTVALGAGIVIGLLSGVGLLLGLKHEIANLKQRARLAQEEVKNLRNIPLQDK
jgi:putative membrane protein